MSDAKKHCVLCVILVSNLRTIFSWIKICYSEEQRILDGVRSALNEHFDIQF